MESQLAPDLTEDELDQFKKDMVKLVPALRAFARGLCRDRTYADDLVQEAMMRAWASRRTFQQGSNFRAWMFRILRNHFYSNARKRGQFAVWDPEAAERILIQEPTQEAGLHVEDVNRAMLKLPAQQREMLLLIAGAGMSYEDAALVAGCNIGTVKSRLNRGRAAVRALVDGSASETVV